MSVAVIDEQEVGDGEPLLMEEFWRKNKDNRTREPSEQTLIQAKSTFRVGEVWWEVEGLLSWKAVAVDGGWTGQ